MVRRELLVGTLRVFAVASMVLGGAGIVVDVLSLLTCVLLGALKVSSMPRWPAELVPLMTPVAVAAIALPRAILMWLSGSALLHGRRTVMMLLFACGLYSLVSGLFDITIAIAEKHFLIPSALLFVPPPSTEEIHYIFCLLSRCGSFWVRAWPLAWGIGILTLMSFREIRAEIKRMVCGQPTDGPALKES